MNQMVRHGLHPASFDRMFVTVKGAITLLCTLVFLYGCTAPGNSVRDSGSSHQSYGGRLSFFLNLQESDVPDLNLRLVSVDVLSDEDIWVPLTKEAVELSAKSIGKGQKFIGRSVFSPGVYKRVRLTFDRAVLNKGEAESEPLVLEYHTVEMEIRNGMVLHVGDSKSLFLTWNVTGSLLRSGGVRPSFHLAPKLKSMLSDTAFVACPDIDTVYMIRTDKNRVYDSVGVSNNPIYLLQNDTRGDDTIYVVTDRDAEIKIMSASANKVVEKYALPMTRNLTFMTLSPDGTWGYGVDRVRGNVLKIEMRSGRVAEQVNIGNDPVFIVYLEEYDQLAVSQSSSGTVALLDAETLARVGSIQTGARPAGLLNIEKKWLYIAESGSGSVLLYDLFYGTEVSRIPVGFKPYRLILNGFDVYVANYDSNSISILKPRQLSVSRTIQLSGRPAEMMTVPRSKWIYVGNEDENTINVIDPNTSRVVDSIELGARPKGMTVIH